MSGWATQRLADRMAAREQNRLDLDAAAARQAVALAQADERAEKQRAARDAAMSRRRARRSAARQAAAGWLAVHTVEVLIYALAVLCAAMAVPAMAVYGLRIYGAVTGVLLPALTELGAWAFAGAVQASRRRHPDRPVRWLAVGVIVFAATGAALNLAHGWSTHGPLAGVVMAAVSVAGIVAHQLAVASPPRSRAERTAARHGRLVERRLARARRAAVRRAVVELSPDGTVRLVYQTGVYGTRRRGLAPAVAPGLPVDPVDGWDAGLSVLLASALPEGVVEPAGTDLTDPTPAHPTTELDQQVSDGESADSVGRSGGVALADPPPSDPPATKTGGRRVNPQARRKLTADEALAAARRYARRKGRPVTAEELRERLGVGAVTARRLRDKVNAEQADGGAQ
ncbi:hypothetical protein FF36_01907 [Frankia torreyi]|uniref:DUF2637 domain-containing protein n=1 Tax=Frankia torreyi TaxID=1856 RepID=A0A0D8BK10_9ACTN|nr:hypothetical protein [Frankia torreyi]KJE23722.1 hypothetical protein FF36_01907 [Frankia torreyi]KQM05666.1 hypothetical protein FF86_101484 [Frankia sp. CpI1-P]